jgi:hypothetical protein
MTFTIANAYFYYQTPEYQNQVVHPTEYFKAPEVQAQDPFFISATQTPSPLVTELKADEQDNQITFTFKATNTEKVGIDHFECSIDMKPFIECSSPVTIVKQNNGNHTLEVRAVDMNGNSEETPAVFIWK